MSALARCLAALAMVSCAPSNAAGGAPATFVDKADGFSINAPPLWGTRPISREPKYSGVEMRSPDFDRTRMHCDVTATHDAFAETQDDLNKVMRSGHLMHPPARVARRGLTIQSGKTIQFAKGILGFTTEGTLRTDHLFSQTMDRFETLQVFIPGRSYMVSCFAASAVFAAHRKAFDQTIASFKLVASK